MELAGIHPDSSDLSRKIVAISAGEAHTLALTGDGKVYSWGRGTFGRLGTGNELDQLFPVPVEFYSIDYQKNPKIVGISAGAYHSLALADDGSVWSWGYNTYGQLGVNREKSLVPCLVEVFLELNSPGLLRDGSQTDTQRALKISSIRAGGMMSMAIDNLGTLWIWGNCPPQDSSSEEAFSLASTCIPIPVWNFNGHTVVKVACGNEHVVALVTAGERETYEGGDLVCYTWGKNNHGQLGLGDTQSRLIPQLIEPFNSESSEWAVYEVACGAYHTCLLAYRKSSGDILESVCWTFGLGDNGQLGHGTSKSAMYPEPVKGLPDNVFLISIDCGLFHTSVVSAAGDVWSWGMEKGLGLCPEASYTGSDSGDALSPRLISYGPKFREPVQVACGAAHTVLVSDGGHKIWSWGRGRSGVLGTGKTVDLYTPSVVLWPPLSEGFKEEGFKEGGDHRKEEHELELGETESGKSSETERKLSEAMEEINLLRSKLSAMERYASILHGSIFRKPFEEQDIPAALRNNSGYFDIAQEWENMLEASDRSNLIRMEMFYRNMLSGVKDKLMKQRVKEIVKECLSSTSG